MRGDLYSIALEGCGQRQVFMLGPANGDASGVDFELECCANRAGRRTTPTPSLAHKWLRTFFLIISRLMHRL